MIDQEHLRTIGKREPIAAEVFENPETVEMLADGELDSLLKNKEDALIQCGGKFQSLLGLRKTSNSAYMVFDPQSAGQICQGSPQFIAHYHGPYLSALSSADRGAHDAFFKSGFKIGCAIGVDGFSCQTPDGEFKLPWGNKFYEKLQKRHISVMDGVETISCFGGKGKSKECTLYFNDGTDPYTNMFQDVVSEYAMGMVQPFVWYSKKTPMRSVTLPRSGNLGQKCVVPLTNQKNRILTCFNQGVE